MTGKPTVRRNRVCKSLQDFLSFPGLCFVCANLTSVSWPLRRLGDGLAIKVPLF
jgi:hypothetical protein